MYLICFGTRPELIKLIPIINIFKLNNIKCYTLFTGQHETLIGDFYNYIDDAPDLIFDDIMECNQTLNKLTYKILVKMDNIYDTYNITRVIVQGDTTSSFTIALSAFNRKIPVIHIEAGLRSFNKYSPFPEEINRKCISVIASIHLCPTINSVKNLQCENIIDNVYLVGNTIVDTYKYILNNYKPSNNIKYIIKDIKNYIIVTLHRSENKGFNMNKIWNELNILSSTYNFIYIFHPSIPESINKLYKKIKIVDPLDYTDMVYLINNCYGIISDSGGLTEEAVCSNKKILICREYTEREETINCGLGILVHNNIIDNIKFFNTKIDNIIDNPYGDNVSEKILHILENV